MSSYGIGAYNFEFWEGPAPVTVTQHVAEHHRPGANGVALQLLGKWGERFEVTLTSHWANQALATSAAQGMKTYIGAGWYPLKYNGINYTGTTGTGYHVAAIDVVTQRSHVLLIGPGYQLYGGVALITRWILIPERVA